MATRSPAVAGAFYSVDARALEAAVRRLLDAACPPVPGFPVTAPA